MPNKKNSYCDHPGCGKRQENTYCEKHTGGEKNNPFYSINDEEIERHRPEIYKTDRWRNLSKHFLKKNPMCSWSNCTKQAEHVDHIQPISEGGAVWDQENLQPLCHKHHSKKTAKESAKKANKNRKHCSYDYDVEEIDSHWLQ